MHIDRTTYKSDGLLLLTAAIWGFAFVAQRQGMASIGPFAFNGVRFALGAASLLPLIAARKRSSAAHRVSAQSADGVAQGISAAGKAWRIAAAGTVLFCGASLQQVGIVTTTAGNAGFITSLYVVLVPIIGFVFRRSSGGSYGLNIWAGALIALVGLYVLSVGSGLHIAPGDVLELVGALFWAVHIIILGRFAKKVDALELAAGQFAVCAAWSLASALIFEPNLFAGLMPAALPILYGGLFSTGIAYTLQIVAQKNAHPAHASIILSMEALFAGIGGVLILSEPLTWRLVGGGILMLLGMVVSQLGTGGGPSSASVQPVAPHSEQGEPYGNR
jgi:drug/metabolite transporter (DMT)-like permease